MLLGFSSSTEHICEPQVIGVGVAGGGDGGSGGGVRGGGGGEGEGDSVSGSKPEFCAEKGVTVVTRTHRATPDQSGLGETAHSWCTQ